MKITRFFESAKDYLSSVSAGLGNSRNNIIVLGGDSDKIITHITFSWIVGGTNTNPTAIYFGRIVVAEGDLTVPASTTALEPYIGNAPNDYTTGSLLQTSSRIFWDITAGNGTIQHCDFNFGLRMETNKPVSIIQGPVYISGDTSGASSANFASINIGGYYASKTNDGNPQKQYIFR